MARGYPYCVLFVLATELCERFAFYGFTGSLVCFFKILGFPSDMASELTSLFGSIVYLTPVLGAYVADVHLGRYKTIAYFCAIYILGLSLTTAGAWPTYGEHAISEDLALVLSMVGLFGGVTVGAGGIKSNVVVLGADQFRLPEQEQEQASFFNFFYWCINIGATASFLFLTNVALYGVIVPRRFGFFASFAIPLVGFAVALVAFVAGRSQYVLRPPEGSAVVSFLTTLKRAAWRTCTSSRRGGLYLILACVALPLAFVVLVASFFLNGDDLRPLHDGAAIGGLALICGGLVFLVASGTSVDWVYTATADGSARAAEEDAAAVVRLFPFAACVVVFWMVYSQMSSNFQLQGLQMNLHTMGTELSPATLNVFDSVVIMLLIPCVDRGLYPCLAKAGIRPAMLSKIAVGFGFAMASVIVAGFVERARRASPPLPPDLHSGGNNGTASLCGGGSNVTMHDLSIWWQTPQYALIGFGEIFAAITCYELFYSTVPAHMRSVCQSINLLCTAFGSLAAAGLNSACASWVPNDLDHGHLDDLFFLLAGLMGFNILVFLFLSSGFDETSPPGRPHDDGEASRDPTILSLSGAVGPAMRLSGAESLHRSTGRSTASTRVSGLTNEHLGDPLIEDEEA
jgi:peptide/histidine transporter 3/4